MTPPPPPNPKVPATRALTVLEAARTRRQCGGDPVSILRDPLAALRAADSGAAATAAPDAELRESGIPWLGRVPKHWTMDRLRSTIAGAQNGIWGDEPDGVNDIICVRVADFDRTTLTASIDEPTMRAVTPSERRGRVLQRGDLLLEKSGGGELQPVGAVVEYDHDAPAVCSNFVARVRVARGFDARFLVYLHSHLYTGRVNTRSIKQTTGIQNLDSMAYFDERVCWPPLPEQQAIAGWLDERTRRIDALVAAKRRLIDLLAEQRTALITHAVTKGLSPAAPMKPSGIDWLGNVPRHWEVKRLKYLVSEPLQYGANEAAELEDTALPRFVRITDVDESGRLREETFKSLPEDVARPFLLKNGDLLLARSGATVGKAFFYDQSWGRCCYAGYLIRARLHSARLVAKFAHYCTQSNGYWQWITSSQIQATIQNVSAEKYANLWIGVPPLPEQRALVAHLDAACAKLDALTATTETAIARLTEYRQALISAAVTGKINVCDAAAPAHPAAERRGTHTKAGVEGVNP